MVTVKLKNSQPRMLGLCTGHQLMPGRGKVHSVEMTEAQRDTLLADPTFRSWQKLGWVGLVKDAVQPKREARFKAPPAPIGADALADVNVEQARAMIQVAYDPDLLAAWHAGDERKTVKKFVEARLAALEKEELENNPDEGETLPPEDDVGLGDEIEDGEGLDELDMEEDPAIQDDASDDVEHVVDLVDGE